MNHKSKPRPGTVSDIKKQQQKKKKKKKKKKI